MTKILSKSSNSLAQISQAKAFDKSINRSFIALFVYLSFE